MADTEKLVRELIDLDEPDWLRVYEEVATERRKRYEQDHSDEEPQPGITAQDFAAWVARSHLATNPRIRQIIYLPENAPANEIRLLEISSYLDVPDTDTFDPIDFTPDIEGVHFRVVVTDITNDQWESIQRGERPLPPNWKLENSIIHRRNWVK